MPIALPVIELGTLVIAIVCIALAVLITKLMVKLADLIPSPAGVNDWLKNAVRGMGQTIANFLGVAEHGIDVALGASWHALARLMDSLWHQVEEYALGYLHLVELVVKLVYAYSGIRQITHAATAAIHGIEHGVRDLRREWRGIEAKVKDLSRAVYHGIGHDLRIGLRNVEKELHGIEQGTIPAIRSGIKSVEGEVSQLRDFIRAVPGTNYLAWAGALVTAGLAAIGLGGLRCDNNPLKNKDCNSHVWDDLSAALGLVAAVGIAANIDEVVALIEELVPPAVDLLEKAA